MTAALRDRIAELEETIRQMRAAFAPRIDFPAAWKLKPRDAGILAALYTARGAHVGWEALILWVEGADSLAIDVDARSWVGALRTKLQPFAIGIEVRPGRGYRLTAAGRAAIAAAIGDALPVTDLPIPAGPVPDRPAHPRGWRDAERRIVRQALKAGATHQQVIEQLAAAGYERGPTAIAKMAIRMGFDRGEPRWKPAEDRRLGQLYADKVPVREIARELGRPAGGITHRASRLGLLQRQPRQPAHALEIAERTA